MPISELEILLRLLLAAGLGALIGYERERHGQSAGLRTHMILAVGAALAMTLSINLASGSGSDPARIAAQVVSGIGFLGAGAILRYGTSIRGLTTATSLWTLAIVGLAVGAGQYLVGAAAAVFLLIILSLLDLIEKHFIHSRIQVPLVVNGKDDLLRIDALEARVAVHPDRATAWRAMPLYGVPFAVKDNIDVLGMPTTAACPSFKRSVTSHATAVARLVDAMLGPYCVPRL